MIEFLGRLVALWALWNAWRTRNDAPPLSFGLYFEDRVSARLVALHEQQADLWAAYAGREAPMPPHLAPTLPAPPAVYLWGRHQFTRP